MLLLPRLLSRFIKKGRLIVITHLGVRHTFGQGDGGPEVVMRLGDAKLERDLFFNPDLVAAEAYMDGRLTFEGGAGIYDFLYLFSINRTGLGSYPLQAMLRRVRRALRRLHQENPLGKAGAKVASHYDHPAEFYRLWLDESMTYSCAYFSDPGETLEEAQQNKLRHVTAKLALTPGMHVAEIGSGWGSLAIYLVKVAGVRVTAINVSPEQLAESQSRAVAAGVADRITFIGSDYREVAGSFDRVVSIGMMEHVGVGYFDEYFATVKRLLKPGGIALIHAIGRMSPPGSTAPFIRKYIFPGGYAPALSEVFASTERSGLWASDCEVLRLHYHWTVRNWRLRFMERRADVVAMMGERFARMWEFYLAVAELTFLHGPNMVYQLLLSAERDAVPLRRDYIADAERTLSDRERTGRGDRAN
jgi:cyclopropane-fatty-acyl-phospholipid synthase